MMTEFVGVFGDVGSGKTLFTTYLAYKLHEERKVYANYHIFLPNCFFIDNPSMLFKIPREEHALIILDEAYTWLEARLSASKVNRILSYLLLQSRKRNFDVVFTAQIMTTVDVRLRKLVDVIVFCERKRDKFIYEIMTLSFTAKLVMDWSLAQKLFKLYDTTEIVYPLDFEEKIIEIDAKELKKLARKIAKEFLKEHGDTKITKSDVKAYIIEKEYPPQTKLVDLAYFYIKETKEKEKSEEKCHVKRRRENAKSS